MAVQRLPETLFQRSPYTLGVMKANGIKPEAVDLAMRPLSDCKVCAANELDDMERRGYIFYYRGNFPTLLLINRIIPDTVYPKEKLTVVNGGWEPLITDDGRACLPVGNPIILEFLMLSPSARACEQYVKARGSDMSPDDYNIILSTALSILASATDIC